MIISLTTAELREYVAAQLHVFFPDKYKFDGSSVVSAVKLALDRYEFCFKHISFVSDRQTSHWWQYVSDDGNVSFSHLHSDQYCQFLWFLSNSLWGLSQDKPLCDKLVMLNKALNGILVTYKCGLPDIFYLDHPIGTVLGNASYSDYLVVLQGVSVNSGSVIEGKQMPFIGESVFLSVGAKIIGDVRIGEMSSVGVDTVIYKTDVPSNHVVFRDSSRRIIMKENKGVCKATDVWGLSR
ncbi:hypothetical protein AGMMS50276_28670 [Synergistales bacterium]|nr:hypothetical protein AGMMS50276_28670 [Synergistales bacterium]